MEGSPDGVCHNLFHLGQNVPIEVDLLFWVSLNQVLGELFVREFVRLLKFAVILTILLDSVIHQVDELIV